MKNNLEDKKQKELTEKIYQLNAKEFLDIVYNNLEIRANELKNRTVNSLEYEEQLILGLQLVWP